MVSQSSGKVSRTDFMEPLDEPGLFLSIDVSSKENKSNNWKLTKYKYKLIYLVFEKKYVNYYFIGSHCLKTRIFRRYYSVSSL